MRTNEERSRLIHKRTAEIKREKQNRIQRGLDAVCIAVCLLLVTGIGAWMPELMTEPAAGNIVHSSGAASMIGRKRRSPALFIRLLFKISRYIFYGLLFYLVYA